MISRWEHLFKFNFIALKPQTPDSIKNNSIPQPNQRLPMHIPANQITLCRSPSKTPGIPRHSKTLIQIDYENEEVSNI